MAGKSKADIWSCRQLELSLHHIRAQGLCLNIHNWPKPWNEHTINHSFLLLFLVKIKLQNEGYRLSKLVIFLLKTSSGIRGGPPTPPHPALQNNSTTSYSMGSIMHLFNSYLFKYMEVIQGWEWHLVEVWPWFGKWSIRKLSQDYRDTKPCSPQNHLHEFHCHFCMN